METPQECGTALVSQMSAMLKQIKPQTAAEHDIEVINEQMNDIRHWLFERDDSNDLCEGCKHLCRDREPRPYGNSVAIEATVSCSCEDWRECIRIETVLR